jgi:hypothetical protein
MVYLLERLARDRRLDDHLGKRHKKLTPANTSDELRFAVISVAVTECGDDKPAR